MSTPKLFEPLVLGSQQLANRIVIVPCVNTRQWTAR